MNRKIQFWYKYLRVNWWYAIGAGLGVMLLLAIIHAMIWPPLRIIHRNDNQAAAGMESTAQSPSPEITDEQWLDIENEEDGIY